MVTNTPTFEPETLVGDNPHDFEFLVNIYSMTDGVQFELTIFNAGNLDEDAHLFASADSLTDYIRMRLGWATR